MRKELLNKLNKKDKEEFLNKSKKIWSKNLFSIGFYYVNYLFYFIAFLFIAVPLWFIAFQSNHPTLLFEGMRIFYIVGKVLIYIIIFGFILDYIIFLIKLRKSSKLKKEYFDVVPKRK